MQNRHVGTRGRALKKGLRARDDVLEVSSKPAPFKPEGCGTRGCWRWR
jgi:hypothetical protein